MSIVSGQLYIVATPIGNLKDITLRALQVLGEVDLILAEDTRRSARLLNHYAISTPCKALHEHNERRVAAKIIQQLEEGLSIALISDAGTPLISDPGYYLVSQLRERELKVVPIPGASAVICALSASGLPTDRFIYEGFLPASHGARCKQLQTFVTEPRTVVFYEAPHRIRACVADMLQCFGPERVVSVAREMTKSYETFIHGPLSVVLQIIESDTNQQKGELVIMVSGSRTLDANTEQDEKILHALLKELPLKKAVAVAAEISETPKNQLYRQALATRQ